MLADLIIKGGKVYAGSDFTDVNIVCSGGKIAALMGPDMLLPGAAETVDATGLLVLPGLVDTHVHFRDPGFTHKEDFYTGSMAAAAGGVTTVCDMPNTTPSTNSPLRFEEHRSYAGKMSVVDFNHWAGPPQDLRQVKDLVEMGAIGIKVWMMRDTKRTYPHMPELNISHPGHLLEIFRACHDADAICAVHVHNQELCEHIEKTYYWDKGLTGPKAYAEALRWGDSVIYDMAFSSVILLARAAKTRLHLLHLNTGLAAQMIQWANRNGVDVTAEINPAHLLVKWSDIEKIGPYALGKWTPEHQAEALRNVIREIPFPTVFGTDHAPHSIEEKEIGWTDMWKAAGGAPYVQFYLSLLLTEVNKGVLPLESVVRMSSEIPARVFGFYPQKGTIQVGSDADLVLVDMSKKKKITKEEVLSKCGWTPFEGWEAQGIPVQTMLRGKTIFKDGAIMVPRGYGQFVAPAKREA
jgi:dihydroorotase (multifunctional complex type)